ncbi:MAG TPA: hypothetical protein VMJ11_23810 [Paraburkholderia sp.]|uniref:bestrophin-like domain n=1 Tax=Paraburkholderia sp. TaxID=1926495 RepID=UPI002BB0E73A|nr:hypothetical protein [Paraburkholderia sp.]HTR09625.1 hypothetical protein [Paraburkholderia sp.]
MHHLGVSLIVFACVFCSAVLGMYLHGRLPDHHLNDESMGVVKLTIGLIATLAALVLGLLISSAKSSFDTVNGEVTRDAANVILLDRILAQYGPQTDDLRVLLKQSVARGVQIISSNDRAQIASLHTLDAYKRGETFQRKLQELTPQNDMQRRLQARAAEMADEIFALRELGLLQATGTTPIPLLVTLVLWLCIIFCAFGLFTFPNATVTIALFLGALSTSIAIYMILEMNTPLDGLVRVSLGPMREALTVLGQ